MTARWWVAFALAAAACKDDAPAGQAKTPRDAMRQWVRCTFDETREQPTAAELEAAIRRAVRRDRDRFVSRAGRCEDALITGDAPHACLARLKDRWDAMLPVAQRPTQDAIDLDVSIRRVGEAWTEATTRCP